MNAYAYISITYISYYYIYWYIVHHLTCVQPRYIQSMNATYHLWFYYALQ